MLSQVKRLGADTAIYGISTIIGRFLTFLLVPFYTNVLLPGEYGIVAYVYSLIAFVNVIYSYGMESAYFKYSSTLEIGDSRQNFSTPFLSLFGSSLFFSFLLMLLSSPLAGMIRLPGQYGEVMYYAAGILAFDAMAIIPFAALRMERRAKLFAAIKFANIVINVALNIYLLLVLHMGVLGIFISGLVSSAVTVMILLPTIARHFTPAFHSGLFPALLKFGLPYIPAGLATMAVQVIDRPILRALTNDATVGIYQANYRLGVFMMLIVQMYDYAWRPFYFSIAHEKNAKQVYARVLTYLLLGMTAVFLVLSFFIGDIVRLSLFNRHLIHPDYWGGLNVVPIVLLGYIFLGVSTNLSAGLYIEKKTQLTPANTFVGAFVNIAANYFLIPSMGMLGAAWATFLAYFAMAVMLYFIVQRIYPIRYEYERLAKVAVSGVLAYSLFLFLSLQGFATAWMKTVVLLFWIIILLATKFLEPEELRKGKSILGRFFTNRP